MKNRSNGFISKYILVFQIEYTLRF